MAHALSLVRRDAPLFAFSELGAAALLYSIAPRLRGLGLLGTGFTLLRLASIASVALFRFVTGPRPGMIGFVSTLQVGLEFVA